jgi:hypothetical protein
MKTASQIIRAFLFSPDQHPRNSTPEFMELCKDARDFLAMEQEAHAARALAKVNRIDEAKKKLDELTEKYGSTQPILDALQFVSRVQKVHPLIKEASKPVSPEANIP